MSISRSRCALVHTPGSPRGIAAPLDDVAPDDHPGRRTVLAAAGFALFPVLLRPLPSPATRGAHAPT